ncbi:MAG TPA: oligopeptide transporter, OPT family [Polyangia bacterium]|nr:oligopeptide transporter, OPT family [Polyangia bacterium]
MAGQEARPDAAFTPYITAEKSPGEMTPRAVVLGICLALLFGAANVYLGLHIGLTVSASIPSAVMSMAILRKVLRGGTILENNFAHTSASAGESLAAAIAFTVPALMMLGAQVSNLRIFMLALVGGVLGILIMIPLRRQFMVEEHRELPFPEGTACAKVLIAGDAGGVTATHVFIGILFGGVHRILGRGLGLWRPVASWSATRLHYATVSFELTPILLGVGFLIGPRIAAVMLAGGLAKGLVFAPLIHWTGGARTEGMDFDAISQNYVKYIGAGGVAFGGIVSLFKAIPTLIAGFREGILGLWAGFGKRGDAGRARARIDRDIPLGIVAAGILALALALLLPFFGIGLLGAGVTVFFSVFFIVVSARMVGLIGSSSQPISGMILVALLATAVVFRQTGHGGREGVVAAITVAVLVALAISLSGDISQDLKTTVLVGGTPWKVQVAEMIGTLAPALVTGTILVVLDRQYHFGSKELSAPQATLMKDLAQGVMEGNAPWGLLGLGCALGLCVEVMGISALAFAIGLYLPLETSSSLILGGLLAGAAARFSPGGEAAGPRIERGTLFASGLVAGDALTGLLVTAAALWRHSGENAPFACRVLTDASWESVLTIAPFLILVAGLAWTLFARANRSREVAS